jgi:hemolysin III
MTPRARPQLEDHVETPAEERLACVTHGIGAVFALAAFAVLVTCAVIWGDTRRVVAVSIYGASLLILYIASTLYHACDRERATGRKLRL